MRVYVRVLCVCVIKDPSTKLNFYSAVMTAEPREDNYPTASDQSTFASSLPVKYEKGVQVIHPGRTRERERRKYKKGGVSQQKVEGCIIVPTTQFKLTLTKVSF